MLWNVTEICYYAPSNTAYYTGYTVDPWKTWAWHTNHPQWSRKICVILVCSPYQWFHITPLQFTKNVTSKMCKYRLQTCWCFHWKKMSVWISYCPQKVKMSTIKRRPRSPQLKKSPCSKKDPAQPKTNTIFLRNMNKNYYGDAGGKSSVHS